MKSAITVLLTCAIGAAAAAAELLPIGPGEFSSVVPSGDAAPSVHVGRFMLERRPVTNAEFLAYVLHHREWRRDRVASLFADGDYLSHWSAADTLGPSARPEQPVTRVSWFAARAYCEAQGERLPNWTEWEYAAAADERTADARRDPQWQSRILDWYGQPATHALPRVGMGPVNFYGIQDLHGLIWEWVEDFNALLVSADSRDQADPVKLQFCGAGALSLKDPGNYAMLMRIAFLTSLEARSTARSLGFRCASGKSP
jgi:formylglycine-generating enzyme required for sulfatase activity